MTASPKTVIRFKHAMLSYGLKGWKTMDIIKICDNPITKFVMGKLVMGIIINVIGGIILLMLFGNPFDRESSDMQPYPSGLSSTCAREAVVFSIVERDSFRSAVETRGMSYHTYWERSRYIQVERQVRCVSGQDSTDRFRPHEILLYEEIFLDHQYQNWDSSDRFSRFGR